MKITEESIFVSWFCELCVTVFLVPSGYVIAQKIGI
jgi:hypothetical protein